MRRTSLRKSGRRKKIRTKSERSKKQTTLFFFMNNTPEKENPRKPMICDDCGQPCSVRHFTGLRYGRKWVCDDCI